MKLIDREISSVDTPRVLVDYDILLNNINQMHNYAKTNNVRIRPHIKSHKSLDIAGIQLSCGASGYTAAKVDEALVFVNTPNKSFTVAYPLIERNKIQRILSSAREYSLDLNLITDSEEGFAAIGDLCRSMDIKVGLYIKIDVGLNRCGYSPDDPKIIELAEKIIEHDHLTLKGLLSHAGHAYKAEVAREVKSIARKEMNIMSEVKESLKNAGIEINEISVGCTPTLLTGLPLNGVTEIRPGNYVFMDKLIWKLGLINPLQISLTVMATLISRNKKYFIVDAGSKVLSSDTGAYSSKLLTGYGTAYPAGNYPDENMTMEVVALSEEHGFIKRPDFDLPVGSKIRIIPNHACPVVNLTDALLIHKNNKIIESWKVHARGKVL